MWIAIPLQENKGPLRNNVRRYASWILVFLDILKTIGNSWEGRSYAQRIVCSDPGTNMDLPLKPPAPYLENF